MLTLPEHGSPSVKATSLKNSIPSAKWRERISLQEEGLVKLPDRLRMNLQLMEVPSSGEDLAQAVEKAIAVVGSERAVGPRTPRLGIYLAGSLTDNC